jgi:hypothetical protein
LESFDGLTRELIEPVLNHPYWIDQTGQQHPITAYRRAKMAGVLDGMFTYMRLHDWPEAPPRPLIFFEDKLGRPVRRPRPIPESVMQQLEAHLHLLHHTHVTSLRSFASLDSALKTRCICEKTAWIGTRLAIRGCVGITISCVEMGDYCP